MRIRTVTGLALAGATLLAACGGSGSPAAAPASTPGHTTRATATAAPTVGVRSTSLGDVLVDAQGRTLYGFTDDAMGASTCAGSCAGIWPPFTVRSAWTAGTGLDRATFHTVTTDGRLQLVAGHWPLYRFSGDRSPGDVNGQGVERFFVVRADGSLVEDATASAPSGPAPSGPASSGPASSSPIRTPATTSRGY